MSEAAAAAMQREDVALWRLLADTGRPVRVVADAAAPAWLATLPTFEGAWTGAEALAARTPWRGIAVVSDAALAARADVLTALQGIGAEVVQRYGSGWRRVGAVAGDGARPWRRWLAALVGRRDRLRLRPPFRHDGGVCWWASLAALPLPAPDSGRRVLLFEDGRPLPFADALHDDIRQLGGGRYSVWDRGVYFSAADGSDPATNGRSYEVRVLVPGSDGVLPVGGGSEPGFAAAFRRFAAARQSDAALPRRILLLISSLGPGGAERQFCNLAQGLVARGFDVCLASLDGFAGAAGHYVPMLAGSGVHLLDLSRPAAGFVPAELEARAPGALALLDQLPDVFGADAWRTATHVAAAAPDVLHAALDKTNLLGAIAGVAAGVPRIVLSMRNVNPTHFPYLDVPWFQRWYRLAAAVPGLVLSANSAAGGADYAQWIGVPGEAVRTVHNGLDEAALRVPADDEVAALRRELGIGAGDPVLAGVFRLSAEKRPFLWLEVVAALRREQPDLHALHVGHGPDHAAVVQRIAALGLQDCVHLLGRRPDPFAALCAADLLLLTSTFEGIPNVALEAQWLERPVVCTAAGGSVEAVQHGVTGFVVDEPTVPPLAAACATILRDRELGRRMGRAGRAFVTSTFAVDRMVEGSLALYRGPASSAGCAAR